MKILKTIYYIFLVLIALIAISLVVSVFPIPGNFKMMVVLSGSMQPAIKIGSVVMVKSVSEYKVGDIITFGPYSKTKPPTTHRIYEIQEQSGQKIYITKGDANDSPDSRQISQRDIVGKVLFDVPYLGFVIDFTKRPMGFMLILVVPAIAIIFDEVKKIIGEVKKIKKAKKHEENL